MCAEKTKSFLLVAGLSVAVLLGSAPARGDGVTCRVEKSIAEVIPVDGKDRHTVPCPNGTVLTGGGAQCGQTPLTTGLDILSSTYPDEDPANWTCTWENDSRQQATCQCKAICCSESSTLPAQCVHDPCSTGVALEAGPPACDPDIAAVCACDPFCCTNSWDGFCVHEYQELSGNNCSSNNGCLAACGCQ